MMHTTSLRHTIVTLSGGLLLLLLTAGRTADDSHVSGDSPPPSRDSLATDFSDYIWPTDAGRKMTSSFAEFRRTHFHGGIDIGTGSTTGYQVFAMRDGYVARISISPNGYGKMLYLRHADGFMTTYAHLARFNREITARVVGEQHRREAYPVEIECGPRDIPVRKGEVIAYTGESGVGTPHLHFELRDPNGDFVNPSLAPALRVDDTIPPTVRHLAVRPLGERSTLDGGWAPKIFTPTRDAKRALTIGEPIHLTGLAGFAVDARDVSNASGFRHGVYRHELFIDSTLVSSVRLDRAPSSDAQQIMLYYDWDLLGTGRGRFERLYLDTPHRLLFHPGGTTSRGVVDSERFTAGLHPFRLLTTDFNGNSTEVTGTIVFNHPPSFTLSRGEKEFTLEYSPDDGIGRFLLFSKRYGGPGWNIKTLFPDPQGGRPRFTLPHPEGAYDVLKVVAENSFGTRSQPQFLFFSSPKGHGGTMRIEHILEREFVRLVVATSGEFTAPPAVTVYEGESRRGVDLTPHDINRYSGSFTPLQGFSGTRRIVARGEVNGRPASANAEFDVHPIAPGDSGSISIDDGALTIYYDPASVFHPVLLRVRTTGSAGDRSYELLPENTVLNSGLSVVVRTPPSGRTRGLFVERAGRDEILSAIPLENGRVFAGRLTRSLGTLYVAADETPPQIARLSVSRTSGRMPVITFRYGDNLSGVDYQALNMYIDGTVAVPEIDGEHRRAVLHVSEPLAPGSHRVLIRIKDRLGNASEVERAFSVR